jgi:hypothetical protein
MTETGFTHLFSFPEGGTLVIRFSTFTPRITFHANDQLTVEILEGENAGFRETLPYQAALPRANLVVLSWQDRLGRSVVHTLDLDVGRSYTVIAPPKGSLLRLEGKVEQGRAGPL